MKFVDGQQGIIEAAGFQAFKGKAQGGVGTNQESGGVVIQELLKGY